MSGLIFISYRREESRWSARSLYDRLSASFGPKQIFMDIDAIALGEDFIKAIERTVSECDVLIAIIGANWLTSKDDQGDRRLNDPEDFVRMEIANALSRDIRVIPVLVDGALMPRPTELPDDLKPLVRRNALRISDTSFDGDCQRLVAAIKQVLETERLQKERLEAQRHELEEKERLEAGRRQKEEQEQLETERLQKECLEAQRLEKERLETERLEKERLEAERHELEEKERLEAGRRQKEEQEQLEAEQCQREETEHIAQRREREQTERAAAEIRERQEKEQPDTRRREHEEQERLETEQREQQRLENERLEAELKNKNKEPPARSNFTAIVAILRLASVVCYILGVFFAISGISSIGSSSNVSGGVAAIAVSRFCAYSVS
jgi:TIR domain